MTEQEAVVAIAKVLVQLWYDPERPFNVQGDAYHLVCRITRNLLGCKEDTYDRAITERDATAELCNYYHIF